MPTVARPPSNTQVAKTTLDRISASSTDANFGRPVKLNGPQLEAFGKRLQTLAKKDPEKAAQLLQRTMDLYGAEKIKVEIKAPVVYAGRNAFASMVHNVITAIHKANPDIQPPPDMNLAR